METGIRRTARGPATFAMPVARFKDVEGVHPQTGLATDYLNHYNEIVMLLDLVPAMPECIEDVSAWTPKSYVEHFRDSGLGIADGVIAAYESAPRTYRAAFDATVRELDEFLYPAIAEIAEAVEAGDQEQIPLIVEQTLDMARGFLGKLNGIIHGHAAAEEIDATDDTEMAQALADALF